MAGWDKCVVSKAARCGECAICTVHVSVYLIQPKCLDCTLSVHWLLGLRLGANYLHRFFNQVAMNFLSACDNTVIIGRAHTGESVATWYGEQYERSSVSIRYVCVPTNMRFT
jgi:hypothetical protein